MQCNARKILEGHASATARNAAVWTGGLRNSSLSPQASLSAPTVPGVPHWRLLPHLLLGGGLSMLQPLLPKPCFAGLSSCNCFRVRLLSRSGLRPQRFQHLCSQQASRTPPLRTMYGASWALDRRALKQGTLLAK